ncbi:PhoH family protein [bacterium]|nr:PhoH family protein [bacterium]
MSKILVDTNLLLDDPEIIFKLRAEYDIIVLSIVVLKELDKHKFNPDLSYSARQAIRAILEFKMMYPDQLEFIVNTTDLSNNDELIIAAAEKTGATVATKDMSMTLIAESKGINTKLYSNTEADIYNPYVYFEEAELVDKFEYLQRYTDAKYLEVMQYLEETQGASRSGWFFMFVNNNDTTVTIYANNPKISTFERIDNIPKYKVMGNRDFKLEAKDQYQMCAFYALENADNLLLTGKWGSGKSLISTAYCVSYNKKKTFIARPPVGIDRKYQIGYLPGGVFDKLSSWAMGFLSSLYFLFGNTQNQEKDNQAFDYVKSEMFTKYFELIDINSIQGLSLLDDVLMVDECQLCTISLLSSILSRATDESKIILTGDLVQSFGNIRSSESGLLKLLRSLPHESMAFVDLKTSYRSKLTELADKLQDKSF